MWLDFSQSFHYNRVNPPAHPNILAINSSCFPLLNVVTHDERSLPVIAVIPTAHQVYPRDLVRSGFPPVLFVLVNIQKNTRSPGHLTSKWKSSVVDKEIVAGQGEFPESFYRPMKISSPMIPSLGEVLIPGAVLSSKIIISR